MASNNWVTPVLRQFLVSAGVSLSTMEHSLVFGYTTILLPQLRNDDVIVIDENSASWIASIVGLSAFLGIITGLLIIGRCGRRNANLVSAITQSFGWLLIYLSNSVAMIMSGRFIQGFAMGISNMASAILVGEYTTPRYRGAFLTMTVAGLVTGGLIVHAVGSFLSWYNTALFCLCIAITDTVLIMLSPESPVFLAASGKYDQCRKAFHWLRGFNEEEELEKMIITAVANRDEKQTAMNSIGLLKKFKINIKRAFTTLNKSEFHKPLIILLHFYLCQAWCANITLDVYAVDIYHVLIGKDINIFPMLLSMDIFRIISTFTAIVLNTKFKRRPLFKLCCCLNVFVLFIIAIYSYVIEKDMLVLDHPAIGGTLICLLTLTSGAGPVSSSTIISGEIFPLKYRSICTMITSMFLSVNVGIAVKTQPYMFSSLGVYGTFFVYGVICTYGTFVAILMLPETKDRTLQDLEEECWKKSVNLDLTNQVMTELNNEDSKTLMSE